MTLHEDSWFGVGISYLATVAAYLQESASDIDWLGLGAALLLITRLIQDVPRAIKYVCGLFKRSDDDSNG